MLNRKTVDRVERERERERVTLLTNNVACLASLFSDVLNIIKNNKHVNKDSFKIRVGLCEF